MPLPSKQPTPKKTPPKSAPANTGPEATELSALVDRILKSEHFVDDPDRPGLLKFLFERRSVRQSAFVIETEHFGLPHNDFRFDEGHARNKCLEIRRALEAYSATAVEKRWLCSLPPVKRGSGGYQLKFDPIKHQRLAVDLFWKPHLAMINQVSIIGGVPLFLFDPASNNVFRFYHFNEDGKDDDIIEKFATAYPDFSKPGLQPLRNAYLTTGEVRAFEALQDWFLGRTGVRLKRKTSREVSDADFLKSSPILLGRPGTNRFIKEVMDAEQTEQLAYRTSRTLGAVQIRKPRPTERAALSHLPFTKAGRLGPTKGWKTIFGLVTRIRHISGYGHATIISADSQSNVLSQVIEQLTNEEKLKVLLAKTGWPPDEDLPDSFEMLFSVTRSPAGLEGEGHAEFLACRPYLIENESWALQ